MFLDAERETGPIWAREDDPRCTPLGRFLRRFDLDELPQIWNVLQGRHVARRPAARAARTSSSSSSSSSRSTCSATRCRSGITGWAQVNGWRGNTSIEKRIEFDLYYIENWSLRLDLKIMWLTARQRGLFKHAY